MSPSGIHQAIHGYREDHRLLSSSLALNTDSARAMLVLSDMSGPAMQPGFGEYLTAYPLPGSELFVFAKTWYAQEMQRPGCVWTHSLLLSREQVSRASASHLLSKLRRPQQEGVESAATTPLEFEGDTADAGKVDGLEDASAAGAIVGAVLGQARPVIATVEGANQLEFAFLQLWDELWPAAKIRFSFCTGALMPRSVAGALMDLQAVPRAIPSSQFRKSAGAALVIDVRTVGVDTWVEHFMNHAKDGDARFRAWFDAAAGDALRGVGPSLVSIYDAWHAQGSSARSALASVVTAKDLDANTRSRLVGMLFERADSEGGASRRRELVQALCGPRDADLASIETVLKDQTRRLFEESRAEAVVLVLSLLGGELTDLGERVLRAAVHLLVPSDLEMIPEPQTSLLPTIVGANPTLASSSFLWNRVGSRSEEVLSQLAAIKLNGEERGAVVDAVIASGRNVSVEALVRFGGRDAIFRALTALAAEQIQLSWPWRSALSAQADTVLDWIESLPSPSLRELEVGSWFLSPRFTQARLAGVWKLGTAGAGTLSPRVAALGLALAFWEGLATSPLFAACFQPTYDAVGTSRLEYEEWDWLREQAPSLSWYRDWDRCERLVAAVARLFENQGASLGTVFAVIHSAAAIRKLAIVLGDDRDTRQYLKRLRKEAESSVIGSRDQREALVDGW